MIDLENKTIMELRQLLDDNLISSEQLLNYYHNKIEENKSLNLINEEYYELALVEARESDERRKQGNVLSAIDGIVYVLKDNINSKKTKTTCSSRMLEDYESVYDATLVKHLKEAGAILLAKSNMDEFAMGSTNENSAFSTPKNPVNNDYVVGGSSGGSAGAVKADLCAFSIGTDTGGSIRQPASFCGVVGLKPTYGRVSRYGVVAFASSLDQAGPITKTVEDANIVLSVLSGYDEKDNTSSKQAKFEKITLKEDVKGMKIGVDYSIINKLNNVDVKNSILNAIETYKESGVEIEEIDLGFLDYSLPAYYVISSAEASSNLERFDGIRYEHRGEGKNIEEIYFNSRSEGFGKEVKRRIMLGNFVLSAGYFDAYYNKAVKVREYIKNKVSKIYENVDAILLPTAPTTAFKIGEKTSNPLEMYLGDIFTVFVNLVGVSSINVPCGLDANGMPIGMQLVGNKFEEEKILNLANKFERRAK